eukprot:TRINITY_DN4938_c0_g1_i1.p1 TRINITY_DN4938_c0_g1~~TRINITY_DN4938_c0_g1_i1.p1  ORF type:complete len:144 (-),score=25.35 TRINITY_DN4938_c0_g1_i1:315-746(-)
MYRLNGFKTMREVDEYEKHTKKIKQRQRQFPMAPTYSGASPLLPQGTSTRRKRKGVKLMREDEVQTMIKRPKLMEKGEKEKMTVAEQKLASSLHLKPKTLGEIKENVSQQVYTYGLLNPGQAGQQIIKVDVNSEGKLQCSYSW